MYINIHPGAHVGQGTETGCRLISEGLNQVFERTTGAHGGVETMAGKGTNAEALSRSSPRSNRTRGE